MSEQEMTVVPVEEQISQELVKHNVTDALIEKLKTEYMPLQIKGIDDKGTYLLVKEARKECKKWRVMAKKICEEGRAQAVAVQKAWVAKEKDVTGRISEVEDYLERHETKYEEDVEADKLRRKREQEEQFILRQQRLSGMNVLYADGMFTLGEVSFEMSMIKECDKEIWEADILPKFEEAHKIVMAEILEQERIKQEREDELKRQQEELEQQRLELQKQQEQLRQAQEEQERKQREEEEKKAAEAKAARDAKQKVRIDQLSALGLKYDYNDNHFKGYGCFVPHLDIQCDNDEVWAKKVEKMTDQVAKIKEEEEQKRLAEIEAQKEVERKRTLGFSRFQTLKAFNYTSLSTEKLAEFSDKDWDDFHNTVKQQYETDQKLKWEQEQEEKRQKEEVDRLAKLEAAKDKEKWDEMVKQVNALELYDMRSSQYRTKAQKFRQKLDELKAICNG